VEGTGPDSDDFGWYRDFTSSWIAAFHYDSFSLTLWMETLTGKQYAFNGFPKGKWQALKAAQSKGKFFDQHIKGRYGS